MPASSPHTGGLEGALLGERYLVQQRIGGGGFGVVYQAEHALTGRSFAIKVLRSDLGERPKLAERFVREATTTARIEHENVVDIIDVGRTEEGALYFAMELLRGETLEDTLLREGRLPWRRVRAIGLQICDGLRAAHERGIVHRDLKPANIYRVTRGGDPDFIKILDFGIAKLLDDGPHGEGGGLTSNYEVLGTPLYMSPEQTAADPVDWRTDIYAVGVMMFEMLTGQRPYRGDTHVELISKILIGEVPRMAELAPDADIPEALERIVATALAKDPQRRFQDMNAMIAAISGMDGEIGQTRVVRHPATEPFPPLAPGDTLLAAAASGSQGGSSTRWPRPRRRPVMIAGSVLALAVLVLGVLSAASPIDDAPEPHRLPEIDVEPSGMTPLAVIGERPEDTAGPSVAADHQPAQRPPPGCEAALASALHDVPKPVLRRCTRNTGVTSGDRMKLQIAGGAGGRLEVKVLEGSGSREFDECLTLALGQRRLPADARPSRCQRSVDYRVP